MKYEIHVSKEYDKWFNRLKDRTTRTKILFRLAKIENGHFGDFKQIQQGLFELRFFFGSGVRIYYTVRNNQIILLLSGGDKSSQKKDIDKAKKLLKQLE